MAKAPVTIDKKLKWSDHFYVDRYYDNWFFFIFSAMYLNSLKDNKNWEQQGLLKCSERLLSVINEIFPLVSDMFI